MINSNSIGTGWKRVVLLLDFDSEQFGGKCLRFVDFRF